jgi:hypothetical protein
VVLGLLAATGWACSPLIDADRFRPGPADAGVAGDAAGASDAAPSPDSGGASVDAALDAGGDAAVGPAPDAGLDAGGPDAEGVDADVVDAAVRDASGSDARADAGPIDIGADDAGVHPDAAGRDDAGVADAGAVDAGRVLPFRIEPSRVEEGLGSDMGARPVPILLTAAPGYFAGFCQVTGAGQVASASGGGVSMSQDRARLAFQARVGVDPQNDDRIETASLRLVCDSGIDETFSIEVEGRPELVLSGVVDAATVSGRYARVTLTDVVVTGSVPLQLVATAGVRIDGVLDLSAGPTAISAARTDSGPGGCPGGAVGADAPCPPRGGGAGGVGAGGGGGAGAVPGDDGGGSGGGTVGGRAGRPDTLDGWLVPLSAYGGGGGGGGTGAAATSGRGGGGVLGLTSLGPLSLGGATAIVRARGGGTGLVSSCASGSPGGAGGKNGIFRRVFGRGPQTGLLLDVGGGSSPSGAPGACLGGAGGDGWLRVDGYDWVPQRQGVGAESRGPMVRWNDTPIVTVTAGNGARVHGATQGSVRYRWDGGSPAIVGLDATGQARVPYPSVPGIHELCLSPQRATGTQADDVWTCVRYALLD